MSPNFFLIVGIVCALIALVGGIWWWMSVKNTPFSDISTVTIQFSHGVIRAEIASSPLKHAAGLSSRPVLAPDTGMLFVFSSPQQPAFWMKGMRFPLDFIWLRNNVVVDLNKNVPIPQNILDFNIIRPEHSIDMVLEVNVGTIEKMGVKVGDEVKILNP